MWRLLRLIYSSKEIAEFTDRACGSCTVSSNVLAIVIPVMELGSSCVAVSETPMFKAEVRLTDLSKMELIRYCLLALEVNESSVSPTENANFFEITAWRGWGKPVVNFSGFKIALHYFWMICLAISSYAKKLASAVLSLAVRNNRHMCIME